MANTPTTRLGLLKPAVSDNYDIGVHNGNMDSLDALVTPDVIDLPSVATPATPSSSLKLFNKKRAGRHMLNVMGPSGLDTPLQPALFSNSMYMWLAGTGTTAAINFGTSWLARNATGAQSHPTKATTNFLTQMNRAIFSSTAAANTASGIQSAATVAVRGNAAGIGGFFFMSRFGVEALSGTGQQLFVGLSTQNGVLAGDPSAQTNSLGLCKDSADTNWTFLSRDGSGTITKAVIGGGLAVTAGVVLSLYMFCKPNDNKVTVRLVKENDGAILMDDVEITATLPVNTTFLYAQCHLRNTGTAINALALNRIYVETDI